MQCPAGSCQTNVNLKIIFYPFVKGVSYGPIQFESARNKEYVTKEIQKRKFMRRSYLHVSAQFCQDEHSYRASSVVQEKNLCKVFALERFSY